MTTIRIEDLRAGSALLSDNETYLNDLTDSELDFTKGGSVIDHAIGWLVGKVLDYAYETAKSVMTEPEYQPYRRDIQANPFPSGR
ncbi:hypothetical protein C7B80_29910 [Cyanosarcina cf. burmensis CCALA 770]|nr:hypothetical protein C7B80_29910 [Cyanosarcina cf. burmensis CCALA 770]